MKRRRIPWRKLFPILLGVLLIAEFVREYPWIAFFAAVWLALTVFLMAFDFVRTRRKQKQAEALREDSAQVAVNRRMWEFRRARYSPEDRAALEAHIREKLGPIVRLERQEDPKRLPIDAALLAPAEDCPCWRAVTLGMGACSGAWPRAEMMIPLESDWNPEDTAPFQLLRDAARQFLVIQDWVGLGSACRGSVAYINAGFAGGVLYDGLNRLPDPKPASLPGVGPVMFYWLLPLKKAEWDYAGERGLDALERRMDNPASYLARAPWVNPQTWFEEDIAPFVWSADGELYCLGLEEDCWFRELFLKAAVPDFGRGMESLAEQYLWEHQREDVPFVEFSCDRTAFFAASRDEEILRKLALGLSDLLRCQPGRALAMLMPER